MHNSLWSNTKLPQFKKLEGNIKTDVLVIGGGICGILCAHLLKQSGIDCVLAEKNKIAQGTTLNTTAKITFLHGLIYDDLVNRFSMETAQKYLFANSLAVENFAKLCRDIDCDFKRTSAYTYSKDDPERIENEVSALNFLGVPANMTDSSSLPFKIKGAVEVKNQAEFNPIKFLAHISKDLNIYENTSVKQITPLGAVCDNGFISAKKIIVATHFPFINKHGSYFLKLYQHRSYVIALENAQKLDGMYVSDEENGLSFRNSGNLLLLGGGGGRTGKKCGNWEELIKFSNRHYPGCQIKYQWATQDCMSLDKIPYIGNYSKRTPDLYVATGFNKWGMTSSMVSAMLLRDEILCKKNDYADIFSPSRNILKPQLFVNGFETISNFIIPTTRRCPHLGCALKWNKAEHTWDCSCHGSRFEEGGELINNPAKKDAKI